MSCNRPAVYAIGACTRKTGANPWATTAVATLWVQNRRTVATLGDCCTIERSARELTIACVRANPSIAMECAVLVTSAWTANRGEFTSRRSSDTNVGSASASRATSSVSGPSRSKSLSNWMITGRNGGNRSYGPGSNVAFASEKPVCLASTLLESSRFRRASVTSRREPTRFRE